MAGAPRMAVRNAAHFDKCPYFSMACVFDSGWREDLARISQILHRAQMNASTNQPNLKEL
jgi:hypothetical protein